MKRAALFSFSLSMAIFGSIGVFRKYIELPSGLIAAVRGFVGVLFLLGVMLLMKKRPSLSAIKRNFLPLVLSGVAIGVNWILLFESFNYTSVATATLCYYMAPVLVVIASPIFLRERIGGPRLVAVGVALVGMILVSEVWSLDVGSSGAIGILLALGAAALYASVTLINKRIREIEPYDKTVVQLTAAATVILPYTIFFEKINPAALNPTSLILLLTVGILHTGVAYALYFGSVGNLPSTSIAVLSYLDPILSIILAALLLGETMTVFGIIGAVLIILSTLFSELLPFIREKLAEKSK